MILLPFENSEASCVLEVPEADFPVLVTLLSKHFSTKPLIDPRKWAEILKASKPK